MHGSSGAASGNSGWPALFRKAFGRSLNPMALTDARRVQVDVNRAFTSLLRCPRQSLIGRPIYDYVAEGPLVSAEGWKAAMSREEITGEATLLRLDGSTVPVQFAAYPEVVTGKRLVLFVALSLARSGRHFRRGVERESGDGRLSEREREVVHLIALGATSREIAHELHISHNTVRTHVSNAMISMDARSRAHLVAKVLGDGIALSYRSATNG
jgi:DNA-binding CsgD family transcriptional regulator